LNIRQYSRLGVEMLMLNIVVKFADCCGNLFMLSVCVFDDYLLVFLVANCWSGHISVSCLYSYGCEIGSNCSDIDLWTFYLGMEVSIECIANSLHYYINQKWLEWL